MYDPPTFSLGINRRVNLGNYESMDVQLHLSKVPVNAPESLMDELYSEAGNAFDRLVREMRAKVALMRIEDAPPKEEDY